MAEKKETVLCKEKKKFYFPISEGNDILDRSTVVVRRSGSRGYKPNVSYSSENSRITLRKEHPVRS